MLNALVNFFQYFIVNFGVPISSAIKQTNLFDTLRQFLNRFIPSLLKLWNNDNTALDDFLNLDNFAGIISEILTFLVIFLVVKITISMFNLIFNTIRKAI